MRRKLTGLIFLVVAALAGSSDAADEDPAIPAIVWTYEYVLATADTDVEIAPIADRIAKDGWLPRQALTDFAAEVLLARVAQPAFPRETVIALIGILDKARSTRYGEVLSRVSEQTKSMLVDRAARDANSRWIRGKSDQYVPGSIDIAAITAPVQASARTVKPTSAQGEHLSRFRGDTFAELIDWAGPPQHVSAKQKNYQLGGPIGIKANRIAFYYRGVGRVLFELDRVNHDWVLHSTVADPLAFEQEFGILEGASLEMTQLVSGYPAAMKNVVQTNFRRATRSLEFLDTAAELLVTGSTPPRIRRRSTRILGFAGCSRNKVGIATIRSSRGSRRARVTTSCAISRA